MLNPYPRKERSLRWEAWVSLKEMPNFLSFCCHCGRGTHQFQSAGLQGTPGCFQVQQERQLDCPGDPCPDPPMGCEAGSLLAEDTWTMARGEDTLEESDPQGAQVQESK